MKADHRSLLGSRVHYRIFLLFIACALVPITALALLSYSQVTRELERQSETRLFQGAKYAGIIVFERFLSLRSEMKRISLDLNEESSSPNPSSAPLPEIVSTSDFFSAVALITAQGESISLFGIMKGVPPLTPSEATHVRSGKTLLSTFYEAEQPPRIVMRMLLGGPRVEPALLVAEIRASYLWKDVPETACPPMAELSVFDHSGKRLFSSKPAFHSLPANAVSQIVHRGVGALNWTHGEKEYLAIFWSLFTKYEFFTPKWIFVTGLPIEEVLAPINDFRNSFLAILILTFLVVLLLSFKQIRKRLIPLEQLQEGTRRIANRDFKARVSVTSNDEFKEVADAFNAMAGRVEKQFDAMSAMNEIDRSILSTLESEKIVDAVLGRMEQLFPCDSAGLALFAKTGDPNGEMHIEAKGSAKKIRTESIQLIPQEMELLYANAEKLVLPIDGKPPKYLASLPEHGMKMFLVLPILVNNKLSGLMALGYRDPSALAEEDQTHARQLADQIAVALSNARLIEDFEQLSWGALYALARAIDAKSPWTAGHSERMTYMALRIGVVMKLNQKDLADLHRAGLLHDIGKLGISLEILDKPGKLTVEDRELMQQHPQLGADILDPISAFDAVKPLVLYHHERYDGNGYPHGLSGEGIPLGARIFAVADVYDALVSDRPYRQAMVKRQAIDYIRSGSGSEFDPKVVEAFLEVTEKRDMIQDSPPS